MNQCAQCVPCPELSQVLCWPACSVLIRTPSRNCAASRIPCGAGTHRAPGRQTPDSTKRKGQSEIGSGDGESASQGEERERFCEEGDGQNATKRSTAASGLCGRGSCRLDFVAPCWQPLVIPILRLRSSASGPEGPGFNSFATQSSFLRAKKKSEPASTRNIKAPKTLLTASGPMILGPNEKRSARQGSRKRAANQCGT